MFGAVQMRSDEIRCVRMQLDTFGCAWMLSEILGFFVLLRTLRLIFGCFFILGAYCYAEMRVQGLTISGA